MSARHRSSHIFARFAAALLAALVMELLNLGLGQLTAVPTLEPLPVVAFLAGVLWGWSGVAGCMSGEILFRCCFHPMGLFPDPTLAADQSFYQCVGIPISYALIGVSGYLVFRLGTDLGRGFPNPRSYVALVASSLAGGLLTAGAIHLQLLSSWKGFVIHTASNFVSILLVCPPILLLADRYLRPLLVEIPGERLPAIPFPTYLAARTEDPAGDRGQRQRFDVRLAVLCAGIVLLTGVVVALAQRFPQVGGWPLLGYLGPVVWTAMSYGMRGALLATSLSGVLYLLGRSVVDRDLLPDDPDLYAVGLYADFVVFSFVGAFLGSEREEEEGLRSELAERAQQMTVLNEMGDLLQACVNEAEAYEVITQGARQLFPTESGALAVLRESSHLLEVVVSWGEPATQGKTFGPEDCWALRRGQAHFVEDPQQALLCHHLRQGTATSYLCLPLMAQGEALGMLHVAQPGQTGRGDRREVLGAARRELAVTTAKQVALALGNLKLREGLRDQSIRDPLTGLFNRRYMTESLQRERFRARRQALTFGVIMIDIDHFKRFNDRFGHEAGDMVLRELGTFLQTRARREDIVCRYGGEEFVVVLSEATLEVTCKRAEDLRVEVKQLRLRQHGNLLGPVSLSLGVAAFPLHGESEDVILRAADAALYRAKAAGRDRVIVAEVLAEASGIEERQLNG